MADISKKGVVFILPLAFKILIMPDCSTTKSLVSLGVPEFAISMGWEKPEAKLLRFIF
jgi:hypothetical protein